MYGAQWSLPEVRTPAKLTISPVSQGFVRRPTFTVSTCSLPCRKCPVICSSETRRWHSWAGLSGGQNRPFCVNTLHSIHQHLVHFYWPHWRCARGVRKSWIRHGRRGNWRRNGGGFRISPEQTPPLATHRREDEEEECKGEVCRFHHLPASLSGGCSLICMSTDIAHMQTYRQGRCWGSNYEKLLSAEVIQVIQRDETKSEKTSRLSPAASLVSFPLRYDLSLLPCFHPPWHLLSAHPHPPFSLCNYWLPLLWRGDSTPQLTWLDFSLPLPHRQED